MAKTVNVIATELQARFDKALDEFGFLPEENIDRLCEHLGIKTSKVEERPYFPNSSQMANLNKTTPAEFKKAVGEYLKTIPKGFTLCAQTHTFIKRTPLFPDKAAKAAAAKSKIELAVLLSSSGKDVKYLELMISAISILEAVRTGDHIPYHLNCY